MDLDALARLALALAIGLLAGVERAWQKRLGPPGSRVAGLRTFGLLGLLGGLCALLAGQWGPWPLAAAFVATAILLGLGYSASASRRGDLGLTTEVAALATFALGALAVRGYAAEAAAGAVVMTILLSLKPALHRWVERIGREELFAALKLLLISVVILPSLPDRGFGPWEALNPYQTWWMVVLIAAISFAGYVSVKVLGSAGGIAAMSFLGGLVSSTAVTLSLARLGRLQPSGYRLHAAGIVIASSVMFPRMLVEVAAVNPSLLPGLLAPLGVMGLAAGLAAWRLLGRRVEEAKAELPPLRNPVELLPALFFGGALSAVTLAAVALRHWLGDGGLFVTSVGAGFFDVDAVTLTFCALAKEGLDPAVATRAILAAAASNTASKAALAALIAPGRTAWLASGALAAVLAVGAAALALA